MAIVAEYYGLNLRRLRQNKITRALVREVQVNRQSLVQPYFVVQGISSPQPVPGMKGVFRDSSENILRSIESDLEAGQKSALLFVVPAEKTKDSDLSSSAFDFGSQQIAAIKKRFGKDLWLSVDVCLCSSTEHGHCGVLTEQQAQVNNHRSVQLLAEQSLCYAQAGADCIAPSDMMDGRVAAIRAALDRHEKDDVMIMSYAAKFQSAFYGPFREAASSAPKKRDDELRNRATYQLDPASISDALRCAERDVKEGADILMVKPGLAYLDVLHKLSREISYPWAVYQVSGEYASLCALSDLGLTDLNRALLETWIAFTRAGARMIISYAARDANAVLAEGDLL